ncbi:MAG: hypothetical protein RIT27_637 [Pseudomonadota bacterium]|jgi:WD40 repeat protein
MIRPTAPDALRRTRRLAWGLALLAILIGIAGIYSYLAQLEQTQRAEDAKRKAQQKAALADQAAQHAAQQVQLALQEKNYALYTQSLFLSSLSERETAKGNATDGALLALEALPKNIANPERPFLMEAEINLRQALDKLYEKKLLRGHRGEIWHLKVSPDGKTLASASADGTVKLWDLARGELKHSLQHTDQVWEIAFNSDSSQLISASLDHAARIWSVDTGNLLATLPHDKEVYSVVFAEDCVISADAGGIIKIWQTNGQLRALLNGHRGAIHQLTLSPDRKTFLSASQDFTARQWDLNGKLLQTFKGHRASVNSATFSPSGNQILTASNDNSLILWETSTAKPLKIFESSEEMNGALFNPSGNQILGFGAAQTADLWDFSGKHLATFSHDEPLTSAIFNADGTQIATTSEDGTIKIWQPDGTLIATLAGHFGEVYEVVFLKNNQFVSGGEDGHLRIWELKNNHFLAALPTFNGAAFSPNGQFISLFNDNGAQLWNAASGTFLDQLTELPIVATAFSVDNQTVAVAERDAKVWLFNMSGQNVAVFDAAQGSNRISKLAFNGQKASLLVLANDGVRVWRTEQPFDLILFLIGNFTDAGFSPDGQVIFTADDQGRVAFWEGSEVFRTIDAHQQTVNKVVFSPDGNKFLSLSKDYTAKLWNNHNGHFLTTLNGHNGDVRSAAFSPLGDKVLTTSTDGTARLWDGFSGAPLGVLRGHQGTVLSGKFTADGSRVISWADDGTVKLWDVKTGTEIATLSQNAPIVALNRQMTRLITSHSTKAVLWSIFPDPQRIIDWAQHSLPRALSTERRVRFFLENSDGS